MKIMQIINEMSKKDLPDGGDCFDAAFDLMFNNAFTNKIENIKLVHGIVSGHGKLSGYRFTHAWCEDEENIYDYSNGRTSKFPKMLYYGIGNIYPEQCKYYDEKQFREMVNEHGNKGPWEIENKVYKEKFNRKTKRYD
jgi:hypothetical protein